MKAVLIGALVVLSFAATQAQAYSNSSSGFKASRLNLGDQELQRGNSQNEKCPLAARAMSFDLSESTRYSEALGLDRRTARSRR